MSDLVPQTDLAVRAKRRVKRLDKKRREALPLFATDEAVLDSVAPLPSLADTERFMRQRQANVFATVLRVRRLKIDHWIAQRRIAERYLTLDQIQHIEVHYPRTWPADYRSERWRMMLQEMGVNSDAL